MCTSFQRSLRRTNHTALPLKSCVISLNICDSCLRIRYRNGIWTVWKHSFLTRGWSSNIWYTANLIFFWNMSNSYNALTGGKNMSWNCPNSTVFYLVILMSRHMFVEMDQPAVLRMRYWWQGTSIIYNVGSPTGVCSEWHLSNGRIDHPTRVVLMQ